jgi:hypothetical protein
MILRARRRRRDGEGRRECQSSLDTEKFVHVVQAGSHVQHKTAQLLCIVCKLLIINVLTVVEAAGVGASRPIENREAIDSSRNHKTLNTPDWANRCTWIAGRYRSAWFTCFGQPFNSDEYSAAAMACGFSVLMFPVLMFPVLMFPVLMFPALMFPVPDVS